MPYYGVVADANEHLMHYGVEGQHWGVRRYQNEDGSYKAGAEGRYAPTSFGERYHTRKAEKAKKRYRKYQQRYSMMKSARAYGDKNGYGKAASKINSKYENAYKKRADAYKGHMEKHEAKAKEIHKKNAQKRLKRAVARSANVPMHTIKKRG